MTITNKIIYRIEKKGRGWVFTPKDFLNIRHLNTINPLIDRLEKRGVIRSLGKGLYDYPIIDKDCAYKPPKLEAIIRALEIQLNIKLQFGGEYAAYLIGLTKKQPEQIKYLGSKTTQKFNICGYSINISPTTIQSPKNKYDRSTLVIQALKFLGKKNIRSNITLLSNQLTDKEINKMIKLSQPIEWINREIVDLLSYKINKKSVKR